MSIKKYQTELNSENSLELMNEFESSTKPKILEAKNKIMLDENMKKNFEDFKKVLKDDKMKKKIAKMASTSKYPCNGTTTCACCQARIEEEKRLYSISVLSKYPIYKKKVGEPNIVRMLNAKLSTFLLKGVTEKIMEMPDDEYILCVGYDENKGGDFQIGLTGTAKFGENIDDTAKRETCEETGFIFDEVLPISSQREQKYTSHVFTAKASTCKTNMSYNMSPKRDDSRRKVAVLVHGDVETIFNLMRKIPIDHKNQECIGYHVALKISEAKKMCQKIQNLTEKVIKWNIKK